MCGFIGIASITPVSNREWLVAGRDAMIHRGPDGSGEWWSNDGKVGLAHRRLAIIDLSSAGRQPMHFMMAGLTIVFNGEIYNFRELRCELEQCGYRFSSNSDTEVLLAAHNIWGTDCVSRLNGMFAFALYDERRKTLFLARDRAGEKPLFYHLKNGVLYFASELKALMANPQLPRRVDLEALDCYLAMGFVPKDRCILQGFNKLPPAHALTFDLAEGRVRMWRYWKVPELMHQSELNIADEDGLLDELENLLENAVERQLVADVPVGVLLSGGVDSSLVTAMAVRHSSRIRTFTISFSGHGTLDESEHASLIARHFGTEHTELVAEPTSADLMSQLARQFDEPIIDSSMIPTWLVSHLVRQHCIVVLGGDGGDELFGGYNHYSRLLWMQSRLGWIPRPLRQTTALVAEYLLPLGCKGRNWLQGLGIDLRQGLPLIASYFDKSARRQLTKDYPEYKLVAETIRSERVPHHADLLQRATRMDFSDYLAEDILVKVDRASMLNSLEVRAPLLDYRLIEFAFGKVPSHLKATVQGRKILLKRLAAQILPPQFDRQRKQGFSIPLAQWLKVGPFRELFWDVLSDPQCIFDSRAVQCLLRGKDQGRSNSERLFALVLFELWRREYAVSIY